ncbi:S8 family serine peptidase [Micromonospora sp. DR5-3]|uniref:S8 family serine peptidase n=1 Tax=unclassified Micromonospora TaxID=2617518 RepID=UPI0011D824A5|nr:MULTISPECIES: S8 family serine peptidase [unclassified Micromonospora]MCW3814923.1 S8 family serine peptidase [Micromonospora sp. DR5-3]TYC24581.1 S8 family serine peptidase [Micromonospora sp. MP36]
MKTLPEEETLRGNRRKLAGLGLAVGLVLGLPATAGAAPAAVPTTPAAGERAATTAGRPVTVTLLTGDRVTVTDTGQAAVRPGPDRTGMEFVVGRDRGHLSVVPRDALPLIRSGRVDRRLFDITELVSAGYDDAHRDSLPLLVAYPKGLARRSGAPVTGTRVTRDLPAIGGAALSAAKSQAGTVWAALTTGGAGARIDAAEGVDRIWLDGRRKVTLDHSVPQIGAPAAWAAGFTGKGVTVAVLDTGVDATHPDLAGKVADSRNFSESDADDTVGHGTHVASIIAGSGAASGGKYRGVAPDATLLSGKVCEDYGCTESAILAGMEWAAAEKRATVVNMSLSGWDTPETDPLEQAVETLTAQHGTLFVVAAGNDGSDGSVGSPATADAALAVGAVDRNDELAVFSSRGPRVGDSGLKPDITAPGVDIVAARAAKGAIGDPVGEKYVSLSGTSMATPHVVGAAALLAQQHPGWTAGQYKATLMASAKPHPDQTAFQQGAGRVDVAQAINQQITSEPASVSFGVAAWPHNDDQPIARTLTYRNAGTAPLTLDLAPEVTGPDGRSAPAGMFTLSASRLTVPAGGTAQVTVTADTRLGVDGYWTGRIRARSGGLVAVTPLAVNREVESYNLTVSHRDRAGGTPEFYFTTLVGLDEYRSVDVYDADGEAQVRVPKGRYGLNSVIFETDAQGEPAGAGMLAQPQLVVDQDLRITVDARSAKPVLATVPQRDAKVALIDVSANWFSADASYGFTLWSFDFAGLTSGQLGQAATASTFVGAVSVQWADWQATSSPYLYATSGVLPGRFPTGFVKHYQQRDLATVVQRFRGGYPGLAAERVVFPESDYNIGGSAIVLPTTAPGQRVEHYNTAGMRWSSEINFGALDEDGWLVPKVGLSSTQAGYRPARTVREDWNAAPYGPSFPRPRFPYQGITRNGNTLLVSLPVFSDAAGHGGGSLVDTERTALYRNGTLVAEQPYPGYGEFEVPPGLANYRVETSATRSVTDLSTEVSAAWTFRSGHVSGEDWARLPAMAVRFAPPLAVDNSAPAGRTFTIPVTVERQPGAPAATVAALTVDVSYDGGKTWRKADLHRQDAGWAAIVRHPAGPGYVSLRATARDSAGNTVSQRIIQAYRLR